MGQSKSKPQQVREVVSGLGLGLLALDLGRVKGAGKLDLESAFAYAWGRWDGASDYPSIKRGHEGANVFWIAVGKSERSHEVISWVGDGGDYVIEGFDGWAPEDYVGMVGARSLASWSTLAQHFADWPGWER